MLLMVSQEASKDSINCLSEFSVFQYLILNFQPQELGCFSIFQGLTHINKPTRLMD